VKGTIINEPFESKVVQLTPSFEPSNDHPLGELVPSVEGLK
jgi:hypothetical protein